MLLAFAAGLEAAPAPTDSLPTTTAVIPEALVRSVLESWVRGQIEALTPENAEHGTRYEIGARWQGDLLLDRPGKIAFQVRRLSSRPLRGPTVVRLELYVDGELKRAMNVTVDCRYYRPVVVTTRALRRHTELSDDALEVEERDVTSLRHGWYKDLEHLEGMRARRPIGAGEVVSTRHVEAIPVVHRGDDVVMSLETDNMRLQALGEALSDGGLGDRIRVRNVDSGKVVFGEVVDAGTVRIGGG